MTIDRLEELHTLTGQFSKIVADAGWNLTAVDFAVDVRSLIDAEIERQSISGHQGGLEAQVSGLITPEGEKGP